MVTLKRFTQYLIAAGMAFLVFGAILVSENTKFFLFSQGTNPFDQAIELSEGIEIGRNEKGKEILSTMGEFLIVFPQTQLDFTEGKRDMTSGDVFYSSLFLHPDRRKAATLSTEQETLSEGQLKIGDLIIHAPESTVFIHTAESPHQTEIYVWGHQVVLSWGKDYRFIVPAQTKVSVSDSFLSEIVGLSYEALQEEFKWTPFTRDSLDTELSSVEEKLLFSLERLDAQQEQMKNFSLYTPKIWDHTVQKTHFVGRFITGVGIFQDRVAIGLSKTRDDQREFDNLIRPFTKTDSFIRNRKTALGTRSLTEFKTIMRSVNWRRLIQKNPTLSYQWNTFFMAHNAWMKGDLGEDAQNFSKAWSSLEKKTDMEKINELFFSFENLMTRGFIKKSRKALDEIKTILEQESFLTENIQDVTNLRRLVGDCLKQHPTLHNENSFRLFSLLVKTELEMYEAGNDLNGIKIEVVHLVLPFLESFLEDQTKIEASQILIQLYQKLEIEELLKNKESQILTEQEQELVSFLVLLGNTGLTPREIQLIKEEQALQYLIGRKIDKVQKQQEAVNEEEEDSSQLRNAKYLYHLLEEIGVPNDSIYFSTDREKGITTFRDGEWKGLPLSGTFDYKTQFFSILTVGDRTKENFHSRFLSAFLLQIEEEVTKEPENKREELVFIPQTTPQAVLERKFLQELLVLNGIEVRRENILILDSAMSHFRVSAARLVDRFFISFIYNRDEQTIESLEFKGREEEPIVLQNETFPIATVETEAVTRIEELLEVSR
jgi:hypothetical protein